MQDGRFEVGRSAGGSWDDLFVFAVGGHNLALSQVCWLKRVVSSRRPPTQIYKISPGSPELHSLINLLRFVGFLIWFVLGPGGLRKTPRGLGKAHVGLWGPPGGPRTPHRARDNTNKKNPQFSEGASERPSWRRQP